jgi:pimeloyl-ACP methyl ester carboxylesterase
MFRRALGLDRTIVDRMQHGIERHIGVEWAAIRGSVLAPRLSQPLLVVHDEQDREVPISHGESFAAGWPGARFLRTKGLGHQRILRDADVVATAAGHLLPD